MLQKYFTFFTKHAALMRRSTVLSLPLQLVFPALSLEDLSSQINQLFLPDSNLKRWEAFGQYFHSDLLEYNFMTKFDVFSSISWSIQYNIYNNIIYIIIK
jgi:hypothetical protein